MGDAHVTNWLWHAAYWSSTSLTPLSFPTLPAEQPLTISWGGGGRPLSAPLTISWGHPTLPTTTPPPLQAPTITITHHHHITTTRHPPPATDGMHSNRISHHMLTRVGPPAPTARSLAPATFLPSAIPARPRPRVAFPAVLADTRSMIAVPLDWAKGVLDLGLISTISRVCSASCRPHNRRVP